jgi:hypothetical protein
MALNRSILERQLARVTAHVSACEQALASAGVTGDQLARHPRWRRWDADRRQVVRRLRAAAAIEQRGQAGEAQTEE